MAEASPLFSIVMPTRNRAPLLRYALQSALQQTFTDYEIIVSNNCSSDDTEEVIREVEGWPVRYVRTETALPMHDSWEFALGQARGRWITFLCDDDALLPSALERIRDCITTHQTEVVAWLTGFYLLDTPHSRYPERRGQLALVRGSHRVLTLESREQLQTLFEARSDYLRLPKLLNSCCTRRIIDAVRGRAGRLFLPPCPDYSSCAAILASTDSYAYIDSPLALHGHGAHVHAVSTTYRAPTVHLDFVEDFRGQPILTHVPLSHLTGENTIAESLLTVKEAMPAELAWAQMDWAGYFTACYGDLLGLAECGLDTSALRREFSSALAKQPALVRAVVWMRSLKARLKSTLHRPPLWPLIVGSGMLRAMDNLRRGRRRVVGWERRIPDILEAVRQAANLA
jgi:hypothetical protein